jgi:hypothetical protein
MVEGQSMTTVADVVAQVNLPSRRRTCPQEAARRDEAEVPSRLTSLPYERLGQVHGPWRSCCSARGRKTDRRWRDGEQTPNARSPTDPLLCPRGCVLVCAGNRARRSTGALSVSRPTTARFQRPQPALAFAVDRRLTNPGNDQRTPRRPRWPKDAVSARLLLSGCGSVTARAAPSASFVRLTAEAACGDHARR